MDTYSKEEKVSICIEIAKKLKEFEGKNGKVNLFNEIYSFVPELKKIFKDYINGNTFFRGTLQFVEINKKIEYHLPITKNHTPLFVIKMLNY